MRSFSCGLENFIVLAHDFVLQWNIRMVAKYPPESPGTFAKLTFGSHHLALIDFTARKWNALLGGDKGKANVAKELPLMKIVESHETFGLSFSHNAASFSGRLDVKLEDYEDDLLDCEGHIHGGLSEEYLLKELDIDPALLLVPERNSPSLRVGHPVQVEGEQDHAGDSTTSIASAHASNVIVSLFSLKW